MYSNHSMPQDSEGDTYQKQREYEKQMARKARESMANQGSSSSIEQDHPCQFAVSRSTNKSRNINIEKILGSYDSFKTRDDKTSLLGVYQQPPTPIAPREPIHDPDGYPFPPPQTNIMPGAGSSSSSSSSSKTQRSLPTHHSSRNGTTRQPKALAPGHKPPHPPSHPSQHSQPRNDEVKGSLKSGPSSGPGDGGGNKFTLMGKPPNLPPLKLPVAGGTGAGGMGAALAGEGDDPILQRIRSEMLVKNPVSAIIQTPRPDHLDGPFPFHPITPIKDPPAKDSSSSKSSSRRGEDPSPKYNKPSDSMSALKIQKPLDSWNVKGDLPLSEESEDDQVGTNVNESQLQSSAVGSTNKPLLSSISGKSSEDSSSEDDSTDDSELSSNNSTDEEQPASDPSSPKGPGGDKSPNHWKLENFIPPRKIKSPSSQETVTPGPTHSHPEDGTTPTDKPLAQSQRKRRTSKTTKNPSSSHRGSRHTRDAGHSDDSSDVGEPHPRPTPRAYPELRTQKPRQSKPKPQRRVTSSHHDSDSDSDSGRPSKSDSNQSTVTSSSSCKDLSKLPDKSRKSGDSAVSRERRTPKKRNDIKNDTSVQNGAKPATAKSRRRDTGVKSQEYVACDSDSDSEGIIDVESTTPVKQTASQRNTPSRTPKELNHVSSPIKGHQPSPQVSPMPTPTFGVTKNSSRRTPLSESQCSESVASNKSEDLFGRNQGNSEKGPLASATFTTDKSANKKGRERDSVERDNRKKGKNHRDNNNKKAAVSSSSNSNSSSASDGKDRSKIERSKGVSESSPLDNRLSARPSVSPLVDKSSESPIVSPEPKVPTPQLHHDFGSRKYTCSIPLSLIDKVPSKPNVNSVSCKLKNEIKEEVDKKDVLDNRTTGKWAKGKRKTGDPNSKESCAEDNKARVISSIFRCRRPDSENDSEKVKKEPKNEPVDSDDSDHEKVSCKSSDIKVKDEEGDALMAQPSSVRQRSSPMPSSFSDSSSSRPHRKKKKKDPLPERSPSSHDRKKPRCNSERLATEYSTVNSVGETNSLDSCDVHSRLRGVESDHGTSRKRERERESSLESTRSSSHSESGLPTKKPRSSRSKDVKDSSMKSPSIKPGSQRESNSSHGWSQDLQQNSFPQRPTQPTQQSSQAKVEESHATPGGDNGYHHSRPASEHESRGDCSYQSNLDRAGNIDVGGTPKLDDQQENRNVMIPPPQSHQQVSCSSMVSSQAFSDPSLESYYKSLQKQLYPSYYEIFYQERKNTEFNVDYMEYLNKAKDLKHTADAEKDRSVQVMKYLEAALYFILSGQGMENDPKTEDSASLRIYKDTLKFIRHVSSIFIREKKEGSLDNRLTVISLRCQSLLSLKIHKMQRLELKDVQRQLTNYVNGCGKHGSVVETTGNTANTSTWGGHRTTGSPSHLSQTPSPAGSVGSEGSQSSGYTTSTEGTRTKSSGPVAVGHTPPHPQPPSSVHLPQSIHNLFIKHHYLSGSLITAHELWFEADHYIVKYDMQDFFIDLDRLVTPLTFHSSLSELVFYVQCGLQRLKE